MLSYHPIYRKMHYFLKVGTSHVISTEVQILNCKEGSDWFGDEQLGTVIGKLQGELMARIDQKKENDTDMQIIEEDSLLIVYKFRHTNTRDSIILRKDQMMSSGLTTNASMYGDGDYTSLQLFPDKLTITVSSFDQSEELLNLTRANLTEELGSKYFDDFKKQVTNSERKKKNTLKKIWSKCNQIINKDDTNHMNVHSDSNKINIDSDSDQVNVENDSNQTNTESDSSHVPPITSDHFLKKHKKENIESTDKVISFKDKISAYERDKKYKNTELSTKVAKQPTKLHFVSHSSSENTKFNSNEEPATKYTSNLLENEPVNENTSNLLESKQSLMEIRCGEKASVDFPIDAVPIVTETSPIIPQDAQINKQASKKINKTITKSGNDNKSDKENEDFSDNDDFSSVSIKRRRKRPLLNLRKSKRRKDNTSISTPNDKTGDKHSKILGKSDDDANGNDTVKRISMEDLIKTKENEKPAMQLDEIHTLLEDKTIDLEEYGNVSLENIESVDDLSVDQIRDLVRGMEEELRNIFQGKTKCERHDLFKQGGKQKGCLNMRVAFGLFSEEQEESVSKTLLELFCLKKSKYFDYTMKVLLPETMAMVYGKVAKITREEADKLIMERY